MRVLMIQRGEDHGWSCPSCQNFHELVQLSTCSCFYSGLEVFQFIHVATFSNLMNVNTDFFALDQIRFTILFTDDKMKN